MRRWELNAIGTHLSQFTFWTKSRLLFSATFMNYLPQTNALLLHRVYPHFRLSVLRVHGVVRSDICVAALPNCAVNCVAALPNCAVNCIVSCIVRYTVTFILSCVVNYVVSCIVSYTVTCIVSCVVNCVVSGYTVTCVVSCVVNCVVSGIVSYTVTCVLSCLVNYVK